MKRLFFLLFLIIFSITQAQTNTIVFELKDETSIYNSNNCLTESTAYNNVYLDVIKGDVSSVKSFKLVISLNKEISYTFTSYNELRNTDPLSWLKGNSAFENFNSISFEIEVVTESNTKEIQNFSVCLLNKQAIAREKATQETKDFIEIPVSFATDRNDTNDSDLNERFGGKRADLQYGRTVVSIPYTHKLGEIERPSFWKLEFSEDPKKHIMIQSLVKQNKDDFFKQMKERIAKNGKCTFLFVHGYNVSFTDAAMRTAQITFDLQFSGEPVFYSWPSQASTTGYTVDEANIEWATLNIKTFLKDYLTKSNADNIYLVAHSMGNRGLTKALIELMNENPKLKSKITEVILAAPDIDADVFKRDIAPQMVKKIAKPITLYVSSDDLALLASRKVHGNKRAGDAGKGVVIVKGVETIDATGIDTSFLSHSYFATTSTIIADILDLIKSGKRAENRETLEKVSKDNVTYWKVKQNKN